MDKVVKYDWGMFWGLGFGYNCEVVNSARRRFVLKTFIFLCFKFGSCTLTKRYYE